MSNPLAPDDEDLKDDPTASNVREDDIDEEDADNEDQDEDEDNEPGDDAAAAGAPLAENESPDAAPAPEVVLPSLEPIVVTGLFAGLALLAQNGPVIFAIASQKNGQLRVTVQPTPAKDEPAASALPLVVIGTPEELDTKFLAELGTFKPARDYAVASAAAIAAQTKAAADAARKKPTTNKPATSSHAGRPTPPAAPAAPAGPKKGFGFLTITTTPDDATISVADDRGKKHTLKSGVKTEVPLGKATVTATRDKHKTRLATVTVTVEGASLDLDLPTSESLSLL